MNSVELVESLNTQLNLGLTERSASMSLTLGDCLYFTNHCFNFDIKSTSLYLNQLKIALERHAEGEKIENNRVIYKQLLYDEFKNLLNTVLLINGFLRRGAKPDLIVRPKKIIMRDFTMGQCDLLTPDMVSKLEEKLENEKIYIAKKEKHLQEQLAETT